VPALSLFCQQCLHKRRTSIPPRISGSGIKASYSARGCTTMAPRLPRCRGPAFSTGAGDSSAPAPPLRAPAPRPGPRPLRQGTTSPGAVRGGGLFGGFHENEMPGHEARISCMQGAQNRPCACSRCAKELEIMCSLSWLRWKSLGRVWYVLPSNSNQLSLPEN